MNEIMQKRNVDAKLVNESVGVTHKSDPDWLSRALNSLSCVGFAVVQNVLEPDFLDAARLAMYRANEQILKEIGLPRLKAANEVGVLRLMMKHEPFFFKFLEIPELLTVVDHTVGNTAIMHLQNGFILPTFAPDENTEAVFQLRFHMDFPRVLNQYLASINIMFAIDEFTAKNGGTLLVPGSHQKMQAPEFSVLPKLAQAVECPAGSMLIFDSTLWHAAGRNESGKDRLGINHQFTRSWIKQQLDYVRALGEEAVLKQAPRTQQLLGYYTRVVTSLDEYYKPETERLYRKGQG